LINAHLSMIDTNRDAMLLCGRVARPPSFEVRPGPKKLSK
jgi:hypothetical protein